MKWALVLVVLLAGCGTSRRPTLDDLTYAEARALERLEIQGLEQAAKLKGASKADYQVYLDKMDRLDEIKRLVRAAWEREKHAIPPLSGPKASEQYETEMKEIYKDSEQQKTD